ncbi:MAG: hypothetical protein SFY66_03695 [Oculatellaceae cyanobacterium bins.114]|nr:hypothetical protein [Oculatellaceae cyanobacterium bins.114]
MSTTRSLLITPGDRTQFVGLYVLATVVSWLIAQYLLSPRVQLPNGLASVLMQRFLTGAAVGFAQWWVLRRYLPSKYWIVATALGALGSLLITDVVFPRFVPPPVQPQPSLRNLINFLDVFATPSPSPVTPLPIILLASFPTAILQGLVLSRYTRFAGWWLLISIISVVISIGLEQLNWLLFQVSPLPLQFFMPILIPGFEGTVQAIALCLFPRSRGESLEVEETSNRSSMSLPQLTVVTLLVVSGVALFVGSLEILLLRLQMTIR